MNGLAPLGVLHPGWRDVVEVLVVAYALYRVLRLFHGTRTLQIRQRHGHPAGDLHRGVDPQARDDHRICLGFVFQYGAIALLVVLRAELRARWRTSDRRDSQACSGKWSSARWPRRSVKRSSA
jgi:hypothetical protein